MRETQRQDQFSEEATAETNDPIWQTCDQPHPTTVEHRLSIFNLTPSILRGQARRSSLGEGTFVPMNNWIMMGLTQTCASDFAGASPGGSVKED